MDKKICGIIPASETLTLTQHLCLDYPFIPLLILANVCLWPYSFNVSSLRRNLAADMKNSLDASRVSSRFSPFSRTIHAPSAKRYRPLVVSVGTAWCYSQMRLRVRFVKLLVKPLQWTLM